MGWYEDLKAAAGAAWDNPGLTLAKATDAMANVYTLGIYGAVHGAPNTAVVSGAQAADAKAKAEGRAATGAELAAGAKAALASQRPAIGKALNAELDDALDAMGWVPWAIGGAAVVAGLWVAAPYVTPFIRGRK